MQGRSLLLTIFLLFASISYAFPWENIFGDSIGAPLIARQESNPSSSQAASTSASNSGSAAASTNSESASATITSKASGSGSSASGSRTTTGTHGRNHTAVDPRLGPGGVSMMTPAPTDGMTFVKVGDQVTFKWNYTSLSNTPGYIDVVATNTVNSQTYTIAYNQSWQTTQAITWDTGEFTKTTDLPFVVATYTLIIYDAAKDPTSVPSAGDLGAFSNLQFGIYTKQPYTPLNDFKCATCSSGALSVHEKQALTVILGTCTLTVLSFTYFASGFFGIF